MGLISKIEAWLQGKKAYLLMVSAIIASVLAYLNGDMTMMQAIQAVWIALFGGALRSGIAKSGPAA